jgi:putative SOS response-associated peptidase YedK
MIFGRDRQLPDARLTSSFMCGRVVQVSDPIRLSIVDGLDVRETRLSNYPRRWNGAPSQELFVIRENHNTGERSLDLLKWGLIPYWCTDPKGGRKPINAKSETVATLPTFREAYRRRATMSPEILPSSTHRRSSRRKT